MKILTTLLVTAVSFGFATSSFAFALGGGGGKGKMKMHKGGYSHYVKAKYYNHNQNVQKIHHNKQINVGILTLGSPQVNSNHNQAKNKMYVKTYNTTKKKRNGSPPPWND